MSGQRSLTLIAMTACAVALALYSRRWFQSADVGASAAPSDPAEECTLPQIGPLDPVGTPGVGDGRMQLKEPQTSQAPAPQAVVLTPVPVDGFRAHSAELLAHVEEVAAAAREKGWEDAWKLAGTEAMEERIASLEAQIYEATKSEFERRFSLGMYEVLSSGTVYQETDFDPTEVAWVRIQPGGPVTKVTLPPEEFPEVHALKLEVAWLHNEVLHRRP